MEIKKCQIVGNFSSVIQNSKISQQGEELRWIDLLRVIQVLLIGQFMGARKK
jgi:hypothetical protein